MTTNEIVATFNNFNTEELRFINANLVALIKRRQQSSSIAAMADLNIGDQVTFVHSTRGVRYTGTITKFRQKNIELTCPRADGMYPQVWIVPADRVKKVA